MSSGPIGFRVHRLSDVEGAILGGCRLGAVSFGVLVFFSKFEPLRVWGLGLKPSPPVHTHEASLCLHLQAGTAGTLGLSS